MTEPEIYTQNSYTLNSVYKQVCVQLPTYADNVARTARIHPPLLLQSIDISFPPGPQQQTLLLLPMLGQTNGRTPEKCSAHYANVRLMSLQNSASVWQP